MLRSERLRSSVGCFVLTLLLFMLIINSQHSRDTLASSLPGGLLAGEPEACQADLNGDGTIDVFDLLLVLESWGPCPACPADLTNTGAVDVFDLLFLLENWGASCKADRTPRPGGVCPGPCGQKEGLAIMPCPDAPYTGCVSPPPVFLDIESGQSVCGELWADGGSRAGLWMRLQTGENGAAEIELTSQIPTLAQVVMGDFDSSPCGITSVILSVHSEQCTTVTELLNGFPPGEDIVIFVSPSHPNGTAIFHGYPCGSPGGNAFSVVVRTGDDVTLE